MEAKLTTGELARRAGTTRKALRLYEAAGLIAPARRTPAGYRIYPADAIELVRFIIKARHVGLSVKDVRMIVGIRRSGRAPCMHVREMIRRKLGELDQAAARLQEARRDLSRLLRRWKELPVSAGHVCGHIERLPITSKGKEVAK